jgi:hypothetical protein
VLADPDRGRKNYKLFSMQSFEIKVTAKEKRKTKSIS